ncbi:hypothetical protein DFJ73DRAFT_960852 [Zopfochytrium polystomum]|nr:hypothetical protein DFJ73DRAFT_960852 [Zopfochytrium polystomum]
MARRHAIKAFREKRLPVANPDKIDQPLDAKRSVQPRKGWSADKVAIVSSGEYLIKSFTYGGPTASKPLHPTSFEGGRVAPFGALIPHIQPILSAFNVTSSSAYSSAFALPAGGQIACWEAYSQLRNTTSSEGGVPLEFSPWPADVVLPEIIGATQYGMIWAAVEKRLMAN